MNATTFQTDFRIDSDQSKMIVERQFAAPLNDVWAAWTKASLLDKWWAPKPFRTQTKTHDFKSGGFWLYSMIGPENEQFWARTDFREVVPKEYFTMRDCFSDENGVPNNEHPGSDWKVSFSTRNNTTLVRVEIRYASRADLEKIVAMGMKEGFSMALENLAGLLQ